jgi:hypothetical protein
MALEDYTRHQQGIIKRYYARQPQILEQRLAELVAQLYLAEGKKRQQLWRSAAQAMQKLGLAQGRIDHLVQQNRPELLAQLVKELQAGRR